MSKIMLETPLMVKTSKDIGCGGACGCQPSYRLETSPSQAASLSANRHTAVADDMARGARPGLASNLSPKVVVAAAVVVPRHLAARVVSPKNRLFCGCHAAASSPEPSLSL